MAMKITVSLYQITSSVKQVGEISNPQTSYNDTSPHYQQSRYRHPANKSTAWRTTEPVLVGEAHQMNFMKNHHRTVGHQIQLTHWSQQGLSKLRCCRLGLCQSAEEGVHSILDGYVQFRRQVAQLQGHFGLLVCVAKGASLKAHCTHA